MREGLDGKVENFDQLPQEVQVAANNNNDNNNNNNSGQNDNNNNNNRINSLDNFPDISVVVASFGGLVKIPA